MLSIDVGDLMNESVLLSFFHYPESFFLIYILSAFVLLHNIVSQVTNGDTPVFRIVPAIVIICAPGHSA